MYNKKQLQEIKKKDIHLYNKIVAKQKAVENNKIIKK